MGEPLPIPIALAWPASGAVAIETLAAGAPSAAREIASVEALGKGIDVTWTRDTDGLHIRLGAPPAPLPAAVAFRIRFR